MILCPSALHDTVNLRVRTCTETLKEFLVEISIQTNVAIPTFLQNTLKNEDFFEKITKMSQFFKFKTSSTLTPYYSYRAQEICSTRHLFSRHPNIPEVPRNDP